MTCLRLLLCLFLLTAPAAAQEWRPSREYDVLLSSFDIQPQTIELKAGETVRLRLINNSKAAHSFSAGEFFSKSQVRPRDRKLAQGGRIDVGPGQTRELVLVPAAGRYSARCANLVHRLMGMSARIVVQ